MGGRSASFIVVCGLVFSMPACAEQPDSRALTPAEQQTFIPLVCAHVRPAPAGDSSATPAFLCDDIIGHPRVSALRQTWRPVSITLSSIILGAITRSGADQAYVSYLGFMSHAEGLGGGALFERADGDWRLVQWYPARQRDQCLALPGTGPLQALCRSRDGYAGVGFDWITVDYIVPPAGNVSPAYTLSPDVSAVHGDCDGKRGRPYGLPDTIPDYCTILDKSRGVLISVDDIRRSSKPGLFATAPVSFAKPADLDDACARTCFFDATPTQGVIGFKLDGTRIVPIMPAQFSRSAGGK